MIFSRVTSSPAISPTFAVAQHRDTSLTATISSSSDEATSSARPSRTDGGSARRSRHARRRRCRASARRGSGCATWTPASAPGSPSADCRRKAGRPACRHRAWRWRASDHLLRQPFLLLCGQPAQPAALRLQREHDVFAHGEFGNDALGLAVLGAEAEPSRDRLPRRPDLDRLPRTSKRPGRRRDAPRRTPVWRSRSAPSRAGRQARPPRRRTARSSCAM